MEVIEDDTPIYGLDNWVNDDTIYFKGEQKNKS